MTGTPPTEDWWTSQQVQLFEDRQRTCRRADFAPRTCFYFVVVTVRGRLVVVWCPVRFAFGC